MSETLTPAAGPLARYRTVTRDGVTVPVDKYGWPVEICGRCGGTGRYSWNALDGDRCYGCQGRGVTLAAGKVETIKAEYIAAWESQARRIGHMLAAGDEVRPWHSPKGTPFRRVAEVVPTGQWCGKSKVGSEPEQVSYFQVVTFDDGETVQVGGELWRGKATVTREPYVERAQAAYVTKAKRRAAAAARPPKPRPARVNQFPGQCGVCGAEVAAGAGTWSREAGVRHAEGECQ